MELVWTKELSTGVEWQDAQHMEMFTRINALIVAIGRKRGRVELEGMFKFLDDYAKDHFRGEEEAMERHGYPDAQAHRAEHRHFIDNIARLKYEFNRYADDLSVLEARALLADWFKSHIAAVDMRLGRFLSGRARPS